LRRARPVTGQGQRYPHFKREMAELAGHRASTTRKPVPPCSASPCCYGGVLWRRTQPRSKDEPCICGSGMTLFTYLKKVTGLSRIGHIIDERALNRRRCARPRPR
jgi:hypothetical protein